MIKKVLILFVLLSLGACAAQEGNLNNPSETNNAAASVEVDQEVINDLLEKQDKLNEIVQAGELSRCAEIEDDVYFKSCERNLIAAKATSTSDVKLCDEISDEENRKYCVTLVENKFKEKSAQAESAIDQSEPAENE
jgi:hypothetical protein